MRLRGVFNYWIIFSVMIFILVLLVYIFVPLGQMFISHTLKASEDIIQQNQQIINSIQNETIREALINATNKQIESIAFQEIVLSTFYKYGWIIIISVAVLVIFILARQTVETSQIQ